MSPDFKFPWWMLNKGTNWVNKIALDQYLVYGACRGWFSENAETRAVKLNVYADSIQCEFEPVDWWALGQSNRDTLTHVWFANPLARRRPKTKIVLVMPFELVRACAPQNWAWEYGLAQDELFAAFYSIKEGTGTILFCTSFQLKLLIQICSSFF